MKFACMLKIIMLHYDFAVAVIEFLQNQVI